MSKRAGSPTPGEGSAKKAMTTVETVQTNCAYIVIAVAFNSNTLWLLREAPERVELPLYLTRTIGDAYYGHRVMVWEFEKPVKKEEDDTIRVNCPNREVCGKVVSSVEDLNNDDNTSNNFVFVFRAKNEGKQKLIYVADPTTDKEQLVNGRKIGPGVGASRPDFGKLYLATYGMSVDFFAASKGIVQVPRDIAEVYPLEEGFKLVSQPKFDILRIDVPTEGSLMGNRISGLNCGQLDTDPKNLAPLWLETGKLVVSPDKLIAAAATLHYIEAKRLTGTRTFQTKLKASVEKSDLIVEARGELSKKETDRNKAAMIRANETGSMLYITVKLAAADVQIRMTVVEQKLAEDLSWMDVKLKADKEEVERTSGCSVSYLDGREAKIGPIVSGPVKKAMREAFREGKISELLYEESPRAKLLRILWGAPVPMKPVETEVPHLERGQMKFTMEQSIAVIGMARDEEEVVLIDASAGSGKTATAAAAAGMWKKKKQINNKSDDDILLVSSTMNRPLIGLLRVINKHYPEVKTLALQSTSFLSGKGSVDDVYHGKRLPALLLELAKKPESRKWQRKITEEEQRTVKLALNVMSGQLGNFDMVFDVDSVGAENAERENAVEEALQILLEVYQPDVVVGTVATVSRFADRLQKIKQIIFDEAGTVTMVATLEMLVKFKELRKMCFMGDARQLLTKDVDVPEQIKKFGWNSVFVDLEKAQGIQRLAMTQTFRFNKGMVPILSDACYHGKLTGGVERSGLADIFPWPSAETRRSDIVFINVKGFEQRSHTWSRGNLEQAAAAGIVLRYFAARQPKWSVLPLSFYKHQASMNDERFGDTLGESVDQAQGVEADLVVLTTTIASVEERVGQAFGFSDDPKRLTVAVTRARKGLVIIGDEQSLRNSTTWLFVLEIFHRHRVPFLSADVLNNLAVASKTVRPATNAIEVPSPSTLLLGLNLEESTQEPGPSGGAHPVVDPESEQSASEADEEEEEESAEE